MGFATYRRVLATPGVRPMVLFSLPARTPIGMGGVALILFVHARTGSFGSAGVVTGAFTIGIGLTGPPLARLVDRHGSRWVVVPGAIVMAAALVAVVVLGELGAGTVPLAAAGGQGQRLGGGAADHGAAGGQVGRQGVELEAHGVSSR
ncbi:MAG TPA: hypothetical protein VHE08_02960 [Solirubrobacterales bacterium]|nr:hypothetical protein [Solirubrobacterales bacterium]